MVNTSHLLPQRCARTIRIAYNKEKQQQANKKPPICSFFRVCTVLKAFVPCISPCCLVKVGTVEEEMLKVEGV